MTSYPFITALFQSILSKSKSIEGRFYVCPKMGYEINDDYLGQVIKDNTELLEKKYPLVLMMPPMLRGNFNFKATQFVSYSITLFFLKTSYYGAGADINPNTGTSQHSIPQDWAEMQAVAAAFLSVLSSSESRTFHQIFRTGAVNETIQPVSSIGADRASGVRVDMELSLPFGCDPLEDYEDINLITIPQ